MGAVQRHSGAGSLFFAPGSMPIAAALTQAIGFFYIMNQSLDDRSFGDSPRSLQSINLHTWEL
jgi:hypothetical protein